MFTKNCTAQGVRIKLEQKLPSKNALVMYSKKGIFFTEMLLCDHVNVTNAIRDG